MLQPFSNMFDFNIAKNKTRLYLEHLGDESEMGNKQYPMRKQQETGEEKEEIFTPVTDLSKQKNSHECSSSEISCLGCAHPH